MTKALSAILHELIDYAGMFPPAKLPLETAFSKYLNYRTAPEQWMVSRFICPIGQFSELVDIISDPAKPIGKIRLAIIGEEHGHHDSTNSIAQDLSIIAKLAALHTRSIQFDTYETKLSIHLIDQLSRDPFRDEVSPKLSQFGDHVVNALSTVKTGSLECLFELPFNGFTVAASTFTIVIDELIRINHRLEALNISARVGVKLRCTGDRMPASYMIANVLKQCADKKIPFKATAGLHHPFFSNHRTERHGFLSLFCTGLIAATHPELSDEYLAEIVACDKPELFVFTDDEFVWDGKYHVSTDQISELRKSIFLSFGSCSIDEPRDDLRALNLI